MAEPIVGPTQASCPDGHRAAFGGPDVIYHFNMSLLMAHHAAFEYLILCMICFFI